MPAKETFKAARDRLLVFLGHHGWYLSPALKVPHATTPDGQARVYFTPQAVQLCQSPPFSLGSARSMWIDIRGMSGEEFVGDVARWLKHTLTPNARSKWDMPGGWKRLSGDINWEDYGGKWGKRANDGTWVVIAFRNTGEDQQEEVELPYVATVLLVTPADMGEKQMASILAFAGLDLDELPPEQREAALVDATTAYSTSQIGVDVAQTFSGTRADQVRAAARRYADKLMS